MIWQSIRKDAVEIPCLAPIFLFFSANLVAQLSFSLQIPWNLVHSFVALGIGVLLTRYTLMEGGARSIFRPVPILVNVVSVTILFTLLASTTDFVPDLGFDSRWYHQEAIIRLHNGWMLDGSIGNHHIDNFARGAWVASNFVYAFTGKLEAAKVWNLALTLSALVLVLTTLRVFGFKSRYQRAAIAVILSLPAVVVTQFFTFYLDALVGQWVLILACGLMLRLRQPERLNLFVVLAATAGLMVTKYTGVVFAFCLHLGFFVAAIIYGRHWLKVGLQSLAIGIFAFAICGFNSYVTNTVKHGNPFHPYSFGSGRNFLDAPGEFADQNRVVKFLQANFSKTFNRDAMPEPKFPGAIAKEEIKVFKDPDVRFGGFGPWYSLELVLAAILFLLLLRRAEPSTKKVMVLVTATLLLSIFSISDPWWARFVPQAHALPLFIAACGLLSAAHKGAHALGAFILMLAYANLFLVVAGWLPPLWRSSLAAKEEYAAMRSLGGPMPMKIKFFPPSTRQNLIERGILFTEYQDLPCEEPSLNATQVFDYCLVNGDHSAARYLRDLGDEQKYLESPAAWTKVNAWARTIPPEANATTHFRIHSLDDQKRAFALGYRYWIIFLADQNRHLREEVAPTHMNVFPLRTEYGLLRWEKAWFDAILYRIEPDFGGRGSMFAYGDGFHLTADQNSNFRWTSARVAHISMLSRPQTGPLRWIFRARALRPRQLEIKFNGKAVGQVTVDKELKLFELTFKALRATNDIALYLQGDLDNIARLEGNSDMRDVGAYIGELGVK